MSMHEITIQQLRMFVVVVESRSLGTAAHRMGRTIPAVSISLKNLERYVGYPLFKGDRKTVLTPVGEYMFTWCKRLLEFYEHSMERIENYIQTRLKNIVVSTIPSVADTILPQIIDEYRQATPEVAIEIHDANSKEILTQVMKGLCDVGLVAVYQSDILSQEIHFEPLFKEEIGVICRRDNVLTKRSQPLGLEDLEDSCLLGNGISNKLSIPKIQQLIEKSRLLAVNIHSLLSLVVSGAGITLLPESVIASHSGNLCYLKLNLSQAVRFVGFITNNVTQLTAEAEKFCFILRKKYNQGKKI